jgi:hypothetical protein
MEEIMKLKAIYIGILLSIIFPIILICNSIKYNSSETISGVSSRVTKYKIRTYQPGDEINEAKIGLQIGKKLVWPNLHWLEEIQKWISNPRFDPRSRLYAFFKGEMVGNAEFILIKPTRFAPGRALLFYPHCLPGYEDAAKPLILKALEILSYELNQKIVQMTVTTEIPESIKVAQQCGFYETKDRPLGYKMYFTYDLTAGELQIPTDVVEDFNQTRDMDEVARLAWIWYKRPVAWCRDNLLKQAIEYKSFAHLVIRDGKELIAACYIAPNYYTGNKTIAALFYQYALTPEALRPMIAEAIKRSRKAGFQILLVDLIYDHLHFEPTYRDLGFKKAAAKGVYEWRSN